MGKSIAILFILLLLWVKAGAQAHQDFYARSQEVNRSGMYFLGGWAAANMAVGTYGWIRYDGDTRYFHQMNAAWNLVNAGIATWALLDSRNDDASGLSYDEAMQKHIRSENIYLINAGLDLLYMAGGAWMIRASSNSSENEDMLKGYGQSIIMQGAFLFLFDLTKFGIQYNRRQNFLQDAHLGMTPGGITLTISL